jgi:hypothetical protein
VFIFTLKNLAEAGNPVFDVTEIGALTLLFESLEKLNECWQH